MDISSIGKISSLNGIDGIGSLTGSLLTKTEEASGNVFESFLNSAIDNLNTTNSYLSDAENEEIKFALGETKNTHDLAIALQKASTALQYTVAVRDKLLEAYKEIMNMQI